MDELSAVELSLEREGGSRLNKRIAGFGFSLLEEEEEEEEGSTSSRIAWHSGYGLSNDGTDGSELS